MRLSKTKVFRGLTFLPTILVLSLCINSCNNRQEFDADDYFTKTALKGEREKFLIKTINETILGNFSIQLTDSTENKYQSAFWAMELIQYKSSFSDSVIRRCFKNLSSRSIDFQRSLLEIVFSLYQKEFVKEVNLFSNQTDNPKLFAMCLIYLKNSEIDLNIAFNEFTIKHPQLKYNPIIIMLKNDLDSVQKSVPSLVELLRNNFEKGETVIFSFQRENRNYPGLLIIKKSDGRFLRENSGEIFSVQQLARSITDLPGYITNGNTPQGILSIQGIDFSKNDFIGSCPNLQLVLPFEVTPDVYFHSNVNDSIWNLDYYKNLLPQSWQNYLPIYESFYAGKAGRNEIIAHGTTIDPGFYADELYYPFTPSLGCLTTKEIWSNESGKIIESNQIKFMNAFKQAGSNTGFFIVVNINDEQSPVSLDEIKSIILKAEKQ